MQQAQRTPPQRAGTRAEPINICYLFWLYFELYDYYYYYHYCYYCTIFCSDSYHLEMYDLHQRFCPRAIDPEGPRQ